MQPHLATYRPGSTQNRVVAAPVTARVCVIGRQDVGKSALVETIEHCATGLAFADMWRQSPAAAANPNGWSAGYNEASLSPFLTLVDVYGMKNYSPQCDNFTNSAVGSHAMIFVLNVSELRGNDWASCRQHLKDKFLRIAQHYEVPPTTVVTHTASITAAEKRDLVNLGAGNVFALECYTPHSLVSNPAVDQVALDIIRLVCRKADQYILDRPHRPSPAPVAVPVARTPFWQQMGQNVAAGAGVGGTAGACGGAPFGGPIGAAIGGAVGAGAGIGVAAVWTTAVYLFS